MVYIVTITMNDSRSIIQGVYGEQKRAEREQARIQQGRDDFTVYVTETQIID
jgi:site-specific DNA-cytosine methylase